jgi:hypothetical protein
MELIIYIPKERGEIDIIRREFRTGYGLELESPGNFQEFLSKMKPEIMKYPHFFPDEINQIAERERFLIGHV